MIKKILFGGVTAALLALPLVSSGATLDDLQAQIQGLLARIQMLQASSSVSVVGGSSSSLSGTVLPSSGLQSCPQISRSLSIGQRGDDVVSLQQFLIRQGYLNASATGYFGGLTKAALANWQSQNGIQAIGVFGPLSRSYFMRHCGGSNTQSFSADPQSGPAPLQVTFTTNDSIVSSSTYSVDFGDGQNATMTKGSCIAITAIVGGQGGIRCSYTVAHTYVSNGTYTAKLLKDTCPPSAQCFVGPQTAATTVITVGSSTANASFTASPTSGAAPLSVQFTSSAPQGTQLGTSVNFGDGTSGNLAFVPTCSSCNAMGVVSHTYANAGTYTATLIGGNCVCPAGGICNCPNMPILGTATVTVASTTPSANIQRLNAPGSVTLQQGGIAEVRNESYYFTLQSLTSTSATIQVTPVGCWNSFPSDTPPQMRCMIAVVPIPPQTLSLGQSYVSGNYAITLSQIANGAATFTVSAPASH